MVAIDVGTELGNGVQSDVTLQGRGNPRADAMLFGGLNPLTTTRHAPVQRGLQNDIGWFDDIQHMTLHFRVVHAYELFVKSDGKG